MKVIILILSLIFATVSVSADVFSDARDLIDSGDSQAAILILTESLENPQKGTNVAKLHSLLGEAYVLQNDYENAKTFLKPASQKNIAEAYRWLAYCDFMLFNFNNASTEYAKYLSLLKSSKRVVDTNVEDEMRRLKLAEDFLGNVEKIVVIDSITVPKEDFLSKYKLSSSTGIITTGVDLNLPIAEDAKIAYVNEDKDNVIWSQQDSIGNYKLFQSIRFTDDEWSEPIMLPQMLGGDANTDYPFLMSDGQTLYFASDAEGSIGGYDIFMTVRDPATDAYLSPRNLGMPYNSPYDDYMLAYDEEFGLGWFATERNNIEGMVTIYVFIPNDLRIIIDEDQNPSQSARIFQYRDTWGDEDEVIEKLALIKNYQKKKDIRKEDFCFPINSGVCYTSWEELFPGSRRMMQIYLNILRKYEDAEETLRELRKSDNPKSSEMEINRDRLKRELKEARNEVFRSLGQN